jgi:hypothetical protein
MKQAALVQRGGSHFEASTGTVVPRELYQHPIGSSCAHLENWLTAASLYYLMRAVYLAAANGGQWRWGQGVPPTHCDVAAAVVTVSVTCGSTGARVQVLCNLSCLSYHDFEGALHTYVHPKICPVSHILCSSCLSATCYIYNNF